VLNHFEPLELKVDVGLVETLWQKTMAKTMASLPVLTRLAAGEKPVACESL